MEMTKDADVSERYFLCRPRGGLNDTLVQIEKCWQHAERFNRILVIDTITSLSLTNLSLFFSPLSAAPRVQFQIAPGQIEELNKLPCQPSCVSGRLSDYKAIGVRHSDGRSRTCEAETEIPLQLDLARDYPEPLILHHSGGNGTESIDFLKRVKLEANLAHDIREKILKLGSNYSAVHVRHSDWTTDWRQFLKKLRPELRGRTVLICSDSAQVVKAAPLILGDSNVRTISELLYADGKPQHIRRGVDDESRNEMVRQALTDLLALGAASDLYITTHSKGMLSGYSNLAASICRDRTVLNSLLGVSMFSQDDASGAVHHVHFVESFWFRAKQFYKNFIIRLKQNTKHFLRYLGILK